jgi:hypothetical protein
MNALDYIALSLLFAILLTSVVLIETKRDLSFFKVIRMYSSPKDWIKIQLNSSEITLHVPTGWMAYTGFHGVCLSKSDENSSSCWLHNFHSRELGFFSGIFAVCMGNRIDRLALEISIPDILKEESVEK